MITESSKASLCGQPARRALGSPGMPGHLLGCCDVCFERLRTLGAGAFTDADLDELYPLVS